MAIVRFGLEDPLENPDALMEVAQLEQAKGIQVRRLLVRRLEGEQRRQFLARFAETLGLKIREAQQVGYPRVLRSRCAGALQFGNRLVRPTQAEIRQRRVRQQVHAFGSQFQGLEIGR